MQQAAACRLDPAVRWMSGLWALRNYQHCVLGSGQPMGSCNVAWGPAAPARHSAPAGALLQLQLSMRHQEVLYLLHTVKEPGSACPHHPGSKPAQLP